MALKVSLLGLGIGASFAACAVAAPAAAQTPAQAAPPGDATVRSQTTGPAGPQTPDEAQATGSEAASALGEDVIVTARRRSERLQDIPLSISAFSAEELARRGASSLNDVAALTPGLNFESYANGGYPVLTIRGLSQTNILAFENNVSTFLGEVYLPRNYMIDSGLFGLERVEVVKGPQSALYGRNAFAGAINYVLRPPSAQLNLDAQATVGTDRRFDAGGTAGGGFLDGRVRILIGAMHSEFGGTWTNTRPGVNSGVSNGTNGKMGGWNNNSYLAYVSADPVDTLHLTFNYIRAEKDSEAQGRFNLSRNTGDTNCSLVGGVLQFYCGTIPVRPATLDPRSQGLHARTDFYRAAAVYDITPDIGLHYTFGKVDTTAYSFDQTSINSVSGDTAAGVSFLGLPVGGNRSTSHDVHLDWAHGGTKASIGGFSSRINDDYITEIIFQTPNSLTPITPDSRPRILAQNAQTRVDTNSVFFQLSQSLFDDRLNLSAEGRYTKETKRLTDLVANLGFRAEFKYFTPRAVAQWNIGRDNNVYVSAAKGVKSGGFNSGNILPEERVFSPEENWTYELGTKNQFLDRRLLVNASAFYTDWTNLQTNSTSGNAAFIGTITRNVGAAKVYGAELEVLARLPNGLSIGGSFAYTRPRYADGIIDPRFLVQNTAAGVRQPTVCDNVVCPASGSIGGNILPRQSQYQATGNFRYDGRFGAGNTFWLGADLNFKSKQYVEPLDLTAVPDRTLVNLNAGVNVHAFTLEVFVRNLFDKKYVSSVTYNLGTNVRYEAALGELRTGGLTLRYHY